MSSLELSPAYGRDYTSRAKLLEDLRAGKDFRIETYGPDCGRYANRAELEKLPPNTYLSIRYKRGAQVFVATVASAFAPPKPKRKQLPKLSANPCPQCSGALDKLGTLGALTHYRCRNCGAACHRTEYAE